MEDIVVLYQDTDYLVIPLALIFFFILGRSISRKIPSPEIRKYFIYGMVIKLLATLLYGLLVQYYFGGGDTNRYYVALLDLKKAISDDPANLFNIYGNIQLKAEHPVASYIAMDKLGDNFLYMVKTSNYMVPRFGLPFSFIFGSSYTAISLCYSFFTFWGMWKCFNVFAELYPHLRRAFAICFLFYPSVVYWGSAIMKDSVCLGCLCLFIYSFYQLFFRKKSIVLHCISLLLWGGIMFFTKPYLLLSLIPGLSLWYFLHTNKNIKERSIRIASFGVLLAIIAGSVIVLIQFMLSLDFLDMDKYRGENLILFAASAQEGYKQAGGSVFDIGTLDGTLESFLRMFPKALNASLFRPYIWEANTPAMLISALESLILFYLFLYALFKLRPGRFFGKIFSSPVMVFMLFYSVFLAGLVAITTNNFGSLVRYKIAAMPFFLAMLFVLLSQVPNIHRNKFISKLLYSRNTRNQLANKRRN